MMACELSLDSSAGNVKGRAVPIMKRLLWLDIAKGIAILWVVYFHFYKTYANWAPDPMSGHLIAEVAGEHGWDSVSATIGTIAKVVWVAVSGVGFHAVGLFIIVSGWSLAIATTKREAKAPIAWGAWYRSRFIRLYPMYWLAHLVYLISPFQARLEPIDWRFLISLTGLRIIDIDMNFMYLNAAWWYFSMLIQLYLIFPLLYMGMRKLGLTSFLLAAFVVGFGMRYLLLNVWSAQGQWILGGNALSRVPEFALGMVLGMVYLREPERIERWLLGGTGLVLGIVAYYFAPIFYGSKAYVFADLWTGTCCFLAVVGVAALLEKWSFAAKWIGLVGAFSYGVYLVHQPYVIWLGLRIRDLPAWAFLAISVAVLIVLSAWGMFLEKFADAALVKIRGEKRRAAPA
jgi:peptidoglycan/LPS O-acetylase OafA/YrhL